jgi:hypothetical protein
MSKARPAGDLDVAEDPGFLHRMWTVQRAGWVALALVVAAGLAGLFGSGPASDATARNTAVAIDYPRFARRLAPAELRVRTIAASSADGLRLAVANSFLDAVEVEAVKPPALRVERGAEQSVYVFAGAPRTVVLSLRPLQVGRVEGSVSLAGFSPLAFRTFVYP